VTVPAEDEDAATAVLWENGTSGIEVREGGEEDVSLLAYFPDAPGLERTLSAALAPLRNARLQPTAVPDVDWLARFRDGFRRFRAAGFTVMPAWETDDARPVSRDRLTVDPGRAFGTGTHESTRLCLALLRELADRAPLGRVLDLGAGSGILGIAAARLGAQAVSAVDVDPEAIAAARHHARLNHVDLRLVRADLAAALRPGAFDLVVANISAALLLPRRDEILGLEAPVLILSGLLADDEPALRNAYESAGDVEARQDGDWIALLVRRRP
jgi:ribosomal protein L11 methyltransferase